VMKLAGIASTIEYCLTPHRLRFNAFELAVSVAGKNVYVSPVPLVEVIVTAFSVVGNARVVLRQGFVIVIVKAKSTAETPA
jgi:dTDP-4-amino-4,6-dideoxygalactose transaminase